MDYLDPRKRRAYNARLIVGYFLVAIVIGLGTVIIVYGANGYGINTKTGQIVQNALLFADSNPGGAEIFLNGKDKSTTTSARLVLPTGKYNLTLKKDGYREWSRDFELNEQSVARYVYPFLFPVEPVTSDIKTYQSAPMLVTQSPDRRWMLVEDNSASSKVPVFDMYDTNSLDKTKPTVQRISFPTGLLTSFTASSKLSEVEWSTDNNNVLLLHTYKGGNEYVVFNRSNPSQSFNVNKMFKISPSEVSLFDKKVGQLYLFTKSTGQLRLGNADSRNLNTVISKGVLEYKTYGKSLVLYVTNVGEPAGKVSARIWNAGRTYQLTQFNDGKKYLINMTQFQGDFYYAAGSDQADRIGIYKNPIDNIKNPSVAKATALTSLHITGAQKLSFSDNARFIAAQNKQNFSVYDIETAESYRYETTEPLSGLMLWMDGHRFIGQSVGQVLVMDYDGINRQLLVKTLESSGGLFSRDFRHLLVVAPVTHSKKAVLQDVDMRAGNDLPKQ